MLSKLASRFWWKIGCASGSRAVTVAATQLEEVLNKELDGIREAGLWKPERVITSKQGIHITVEDSKEIILNFCANNYLGLSSHPEVVESAKIYLDVFGAGLSSVRFICGTQNIHKELEGRIAKFHEREDAILYASCFDANTGLFEILTKAEDAVLSDELNHASIIDGIRLSKARKLKYKHRDMKDLEQKLKECQDARIRVIASDGVFSMDGNVTPLPEICDLAQKYKALVFLDDAHATGFFGKTGRGTEDHFGLKNRVDIINSTLGKALGGAAGGYTTGPRSLIELLRQRSRPYLYSNSLPPPVIGTATKVFDLLMASSALTEKVAANTNRFRSKMTAAGFTISGSNHHPICPVMLGDASLAGQFAEEMLERGIFVIGFSYPVVALGQARIRVQLSALHEAEDIDRAIEAFIEVGKKLKVVS